MLLLLAVLAICVSPGVDLPQTALRAQQAAILILAALLAIATFISSVLIPLVMVRWWCFSRDDVAPGRPWVESSLPLLC